MTCSLGTVIATWADLRSSQMRQEPRLGGVQREASTRQRRLGRPVDPPQTKHYLRAVKRSHRPGRDCRSARTAVLLHPTCSTSPGLLYSPVTAPVATELGFDDGNRV